MEGTTPTPQRPPLRPPNPATLLLISLSLSLSKMPSSAPFSPTHTFFLSLLAGAGAGATQLILLNNCMHDIWPALLGSAGHPTPRDGGFLLPTGQETLLHVPQGWSGRIWARQGCFFDHHTGRGFCQTGDCAGLLKCGGLGGLPPATLVEITLGTSQSPLHFYDVSLVDGFNLPVSIKPESAALRCGLASCEADLNAFCPPALSVQERGKVVACKSACLASQSQKYCCTGDYADPKKCRPTVFARLFKLICPSAYSYAYDDSAALQTCNATRYVITFCPPKSLICYSQKLGQSDLVID
ncbi:thaumatin-like protein [Neltuma alba]|uniref:thaumatin-like protein n=1 Tax=Neltuma alba TaxID=207710 RepID=UPI0010A48CC3|nr:thaumatin-like protein [Prosopis alba]